jgi:hypothetical protein
VSVCERTVRVVVVCSLKADKAIRYLLEVDQGTREQASAESFNPSGLSLPAQKAGLRSDWSPAAACVVVTCKGNINF